MLNEEKKQKSKEKEVSQLRKTNPNLVRIINESLVLKEPSQEYQTRIIELFEAHEKNAITERRPNKFDLLEWLKQVFIGMKNLRGWVTVNGFLSSNMRLAGTLLIIVSFLAGLYAVYYQYIDLKQKKGNFIVKQQPEIKVAPSSTSTPIATPSPMQTINPDIAKSPENKNDNIRQDNAKENNQQAKTNKDRKPRKPEQSKDLYKEDNNIAINNIKRDKRTNSSAKINNATNTTEKSLTLSNLVYVAVMDLKIKDQELDPIDEEIKQELIKAINSSGKWQLSSVKDAEAIFKKQKNDSALVLFDKKTANILWKSVDYINNYKNNKDYIKMTIETLSNYQKQ